MTYHSPGYTNYISSNQWRKKSRWVRSLTGYRCVLFPWICARQTHHLTYSLLPPRIGWNWWGFEQPCWHLVPLSNSAHNLVGSQILWQQPLRFFVNIYLRLAFLLWWTLFNLLWSIPCWLVVYILCHRLTGTTQLSNKFQELFSQFTDVISFQFITEFIHQISQSL